MTDTIRPEDGLTYQTHPTYPTYEVWLTKHRSPWLKAIPRTVTVDGELAYSLSGTHRDVIDCVLEMARGAQTQPLSPLMKEIYEDEERKRAEQGRYDYDRIMRFVREDMREQACGDHTDVI